jgi:hypothetical protein
MDEVLLRAVRFTSPDERAKYERTKWIIPAAERRQEM